MRLVQVLFVLIIGLTLTACAASRAEKEEAAAIDEAANSAEVQIAPDPLVTVNAVEIIVPDTLLVTEANRYYPKGDIVWRGEPLGDRRAQVKAIFEEGIGRGAAALQGSTPVDVQVEVLRFHALTQKARYTVGGVHAITFSVTLKNPETGALLADPHIVQADLKAYGGEEALSAEAGGYTQKFRITNHLANVIVADLSGADGYQNARLGFYQAINTN
ncbi:MAG: DUF6778 family protein [Paracoccaceae bacterium]